MKRLWMLALLAATLLAQDPAPKKFEMDHYIIVFLYRGPAAGTGTKEEQVKAQQGHMANIQKMAQAGKLIVAGPFEDNTDLRGIFLFKAGTSIDEVKALVGQDPTIQAGRLRYELHPWFAAKGIEVVQ